MVIMMGAECALCGEPLVVQGPHENGDLYLLVTPDEPMSATARCKNIIDCAENKRAKRNRDK